MTHNNGTPSYDPHEEQRKRERAEEDAARRLWLAVREEEKRERERVQRIRLRWKIAGFVVLVVFAAWGFGDLMGHLLHAIGLIP